MGGSMPVGGETEQLHSFFNIAMDLLAIAGTDGHFIEVNPSWETTLGYKQHELRGCRFLDLVHPDDVADTINALKTLSEGGLIETFVNRYRTKAGEYRFIEWRSVPSGGLVYAAARDITGGRIAESALREERARLALFVEYAPAAVAMFDDQMRYLLVSQQWINEYRLQGQQIIGRSHYEVFPNCPDEWKAIHQRSLVGAVERRVHDVWRPEGWDHDQHLIWEVRPWYSSSGAISGIMVFTQDITETNALEQDLARWIWTRRSSWCSRRLSTFLWRA